MRSVGSQVVGGDQAAVSRHEALKPVGQHALAEGFQPDFRDMRQCLRLLRLSKHLAGTNGAMGSGENARRRGVTGQEVMIRGKMSCHFGGHGDAALGVTDGGRNHGMQRLARQQAEMGGGVGEAAGCAGHRNRQRTVQGEIMHGPAGAVIMVGCCRGGGSFPEVQADRPALAKAGG